MAISSGMRDSARALASQTQLSEVMPLPSSVPHSLRSSFANKVWDPAQLALYLFPISLIASPGSIPQLELLLYLFRRQFDGVTRFHIGPLPVCASAYWRSQKTASMIA
jgi:hypothetical protein